MTNPSGPAGLPPGSGSHPVKPVGGSNTPDFKNVPLQRSVELLPEEPKLLNAVVDDMFGEAHRESEARDKNPLFHPKRHRP